jgi:hypothetical protein
MAIYKHEKANECLIEYFNCKKLAKIAVFSI